MEAKFFDSSIRSSPPSQAPTGFDIHYDIRGGLRPIKEKITKVKNATFTLNTFDKDAEIVEVLIDEDHDLILEAIGDEVRLPKDIKTDDRGTIIEIMKSFLTEYTLMPTEKDFEQIDEYENIAVTPAPVTKKEDELSVEMSFEDGFKAPFETWNVFPNLDKCPTEIIMINPENVGMLVASDTGYVLYVHSEAEHLLGRIDSSWVLYKIDGEPYERQLYKEKCRRKKPFKVEFKVCEFECACYLIDEKFIVQDATIIGCHNDMLKIALNKKNCVRVTTNCARILSTAADVAPGDEMIIIYLTADINCFWGVNVEYDPKFQGEIPIVRVGYGGQFYHKKARAGMGIISVNGMHFCRKNKHKILRILKYGLACKIVIRKTRVVGLKKLKK